jgi:hypothetical protein
VRRIGREKMMNPGSTIHGLKWKNQKGEQQKTELLLGRRQEMQLPQGKEAPPLPLLQGLLDVHCRESVLEEGNMFCPNGDV